MQTVTPVALMRNAIGKELSKLKQDFPIHEYSKLERLPKNNTKVLFLIENSFF